jgi:predicted Zn-dependent protease
MPFDTKFWDELVVQSYKTVLKRKPNSGLVHTNLGLAYVRMDKDRKAIRSFLRAIKFDKTNADAYYHLGTAYQRQGKRTEALRAFANYNKLIRQKKGRAPMVDKLIEDLKEEKTGKER